MIDWINLAKNSLWIIGLALAMVVTSITYWEAQASHQKIRTVMVRPMNNLFLSLAGILFCGGMAVISSGLWRIVGWSFISLLFVLHVVYRTRLQSARS